MISNLLKASPIWANASFITMARLVMADATTIASSANVQSITRTVGVKSAGVWTHGAPVVVPLTSLSALTTGNGWPVTDTLGYNFRDVVPGSALSQAGRTQILYTLTATDGTVVEFVVQLDVNAPFS